MTRTQWPPLPCLLAVLIASLLLPMGCRSHQGYPGPARSYKEIATVAHADGGGGSVVIETINGEATYHGFSGPDGRVHLLPGSYQVEISSRKQSVGYWTDLPLVPTRPGRDHDPRTLPMTLEAGYRYEIHTDPARTFYWIKRYRVGELRESPREQARHDPGPALCDLTPTEIDRERCLAWVQD